MLRTMSELPVALMVLAAVGCGAAPTPTASPPPQVPAAEHIENTIAQPRQVTKQVTVMGKNGPETITITETVGGSIQKRPIGPVPIKSLPRDASPGEKLTTRP